MHEIRPFIDGDWRDGAIECLIPDKFTGQPVSRVHEPAKEQAEQALRSLAAAQAQISWAPYERFSVLSRASALLARQRPAFVSMIMTDTGFTRADAERETDRAVQTLLLCGEEARRLAGEVVPMDGAPDRKSVV